MKKMLIMICAATLCLILSACRPTVAPEKPVLYLYPQVTTDVTVTLDVDGKLTCTYPAYQNGWSVTAVPDGTLTDDAGQTYRYLYWEAETYGAYGFSAGFCVAGKDTAAFLEDTLAQIGLNRTEANEFIVYWLPRMEHNAYNLISFQTDAYTDSSRLHINPAPDSLLRVFMAWKPAAAPVEIVPQSFAPFTRSGFTAVEWGGAEVS